jgi:uncharacterized membrane protein HdeD (DUF308 family)
MQQMISNFRTMFLVRGIAAVLFGVIALVWPKMTLAVLVFAFGLFAVISGITAVVAALRNTDYPGWGFLPYGGWIASRDRRSSTGERVGRGAYNA